MSEIIRSLFAVGGALRVRAILGFVVGGVYAYLAIDGIVPAEDVKEITLVVLGFYFISAAGRS